MVKNDFIFGLNGVLVDTRDEFHAAAESDALMGKTKFPVTPDMLLDRFAGIQDVEIFKALAPDYNPKALVLEKWKNMNKLIDDKKKIVECIRGMHKLIYTLYQNSLNIAVASSSPISWIEKCLRRAETLYSPVIELPLSSMISRNSIFSARDCKKPKPASDVFKKARYSFDCVKRSEDLMGITYVVGDRREDVLGALDACYHVLYLSDRNTEFDKNIRVKRFISSLDLSDYVIKNLI